MIPYSIWYQNGGIQTWDQACGRRPHDQGTTACYICQCCIKRETVRIALMITTLNDLEVKSSDILNTYIRYLLQKRHGLLLWVLSLARMTVRLPWLLKHYMTFKNSKNSFQKPSCKADPDLWPKPEIRPDHGCNITPIYCVFCRQYCLYPPQYRHTSAVTSVLPTDLAIPDIGAKLHKTRGNVKYI